MVGVTLPEILLALAVVAFVLGAFLDLGRLDRLSFIAIGLALFAASFLAA